MTDAQDVQQDEAAALADYRGYHDRAAIKPCVVDIAGLRKLADELQESVTAALNAYLDTPEKQADQDQASFDEQLARARQYDPLIVYVVGQDREQLVGTADVVLSDEKVPDRIKTVTIDSASLLNQVGITMPDRFRVVLDFSEPPVVYGYQPWEQPTPNGSHVEVAGKNVDWCSGVQEKVQRFFANRASSRGWLHSPTTYNIVHVLLAWPASLWLGFAAERYVNGLLDEPLSPVGGAVLIVYGIFLGMYLFRVLAGAARWLYPVIELKGTRTTRIRALVIGSPPAAIWLVYQALQWLRGVIGGSG